MQVQREVGGELLSVEDVGQELSVARPKQDRVMRNIGIGVLRAEVPDEETHGVAFAGDRRIGMLPPRVGVDQLGVHHGRVCVGHNEVGLEEGSVA